MQNNSISHRTTKRCLLVATIFIARWFCASSSWAQLSGQNIAEFQYGQIPNDTTKFATIYDRLVLDYDKEALKIGVTLEQFWSQYPERNYIQPNQVRLQYKTDKWDVKLGNFYETLGRGTLMRTYQVPGSVLEDLSYRSRNYFHRDFLGTYARHQSKAWSIKALAGQPLNNVFPPTEKYKLRRSDFVVVTGGDYQVKTHKIEYNTMYLKNGKVSKWYSMMNLSGKISPTLSYYGEMTIDNQGGLIGASRDEYGWYVNFNAQFGQLSVTTELKDYNNLLIGEAVNEPPALIRQHSYRILNRSTHVPIPVNESGWQVEAAYSLEKGSVLTFNHARALNNVSGAVDFVYAEYFLEYSTAFDDKWDVKFFFDYARDDVKREKNRTSFGIYTDMALKKRKSVNIEYEYQTFQRQDSRAHNSLFSLAFNHGSKFSTALLTEYTTDDFLVEKGNNAKIWLGTNIKYKPDFKNTFLFFGGTRRGGPACTSGVCYEILDFEGVELRYTRRL